MFDARALRASPPAGTGADNEAATLRWRGSSRARQRGVTLFSPRGHRISSARPAFGNLDADHLNLLATPLHQMPQRRDFGRGGRGNGGGARLRDFAISANGHGAHLKVALSRQHAWGISWMTRLSKMVPYYVLECFDASQMVAGHRLRCVEIVGIAAGVSGVF